MVADLANSSLVGHNLEGLLFGGSPAPDTLAARARQAFPSATMTQAYGLTETNSVAVSVRTIPVGPSIVPLFMLRTTGCR